MVEIKFPNTANLGGAGVWLVAWSVVWVLFFWVLVYFLPFWHLPRYVFNDLPQSRFLWDSDAWLILLILCAMFIFIFWAMYKIFIICLARLDPNKFSSSSIFWAIKGIGKCLTVYFLMSIGVALLQLDPASLQSSLELSAVLVWIFGPAFAWQSSVARRAAPLGWWRPSWPGLGSVGAYFALLWVHLLISISLSFIYSRAAAFVVLMLGYMILLVLRFIVCAKWHRHARLRSLSEAINLISDWSQLGPWLALDLKIMASWVSIFVIPLMLISAYAIWILPETHMAFVQYGNGVPLLLTALENNLRSSGWLFIALPLILRSFLAESRLLHLLEDNDDDKDNDDKDRPGHKDNDDDDKDRRKRQDESGGT